MISIFARRVAEGLGIQIHGDGQQVRDFIHVSDVVNHLIAAMARATAQRGAAVANVCTGVGTSVLDLARLLYRLGNRAPDLSFAPARAGDIRVSVGDPARAIAMLDCAAKVTLEQGLTALAEANRLAA